MRQLWSIPSNEVARKYEINFLFQVLHCYRHRNRNRSRNRNRQRNRRFWHVYVYVPKQGWWQQVMLRRLSPLLTCQVHSVCPPAVSLTTAKSLPPTCELVPVKSPSVRPASTTDPSASDVTAYMMLDPNVCPPCTSPIVGTQKVINTVAMLVGQIRF